MSHYQVVVGNLGVVYDGTNGFKALQEYCSYVGLSKKNYGRVAGEPVTALKDGEIYKEYPGTINDD